MLHRHCATVFADGIESDIVGYAAVGSNAKAYPTRSCMFVTVGSTDNTFKLADIKATGMEWGSDIIQFLDPATSKVDSDKIYQYYESGDDEEGWYTADADERYAGEDTFPAGTAFLATFSPARNPTLTCAGKVLTGDITIDTKVGDDWVAYMFVANPYPCKLPLGNIKAHNAEWGSDIIQFLDPATSKVDTSRMYQYYESGDDEEGWYTADTDETFSNDVEIDVGDGFLCTFGTSRKIQLMFTSPIK